MQLVIPAAAAMGGYALWGSTGAQIGWMIGSALMAEDQTINTGRMGETFVATSQFGTPIARIYGTDVIPGNTVWSTEKTWHTQTSGGGKGISGGSTEVQTQYATITRQISICEGPILGIRQVWDNEKLVVAEGGNALPGTLYLGSSTQGRDPVLQSHLGADVSAFRGLAYMVIEDEYLGQGGVVPNYRFEVVYGEPL